MYCLKLRLPGKPQAVHILCSLPCRGAQKPKTPAESRPPWAAYRLQLGPTATAAGALGVGVIAHSLPLAITAPIPQARAPGPAARFAWPSHRFGYWRTVGSASTRPRQKDPGRLRPDGRPKPDLAQSPAAAEQTPIAPSHLPHYERRATIDPRMRMRPHRSTADAMNAWRRSPAPPRTSPAILGET